MAAANTQPDFMKMFGEFKTPNVDFNSLFSTQRRNMEALSAVSQVMIKGTQEAAKCQSEAMRDNVENFIAATKDIMTSNSPENNTKRQMNLARSWYENAIASSREISELASKSSSEVFEVINKRATESIEEISKASRS